jgi:hypothetical protein
VIVRRLFPVLLALVLPASGQDRPGRFFREDWKELPAATPITQEHVLNPKLELRLYGPGKAGIKKSHHDTPADDPYYVWSGTANGNWAVALRHREAYADLTGQAKIRGRAKQAGFRSLRPIVRLADGAWLVGDAADGPSADWREREFVLADLHWRKLDVETVIEGAVVERPDLRRVDEIGFTDLMTGGASAACSRLDWIEVWARAAPRAPQH